jgi:hypothetical protein
MIHEAEVDYIQPLNRKTRITNQEVRKLARVYAFGLNETYLSNGLNARL